MTLWGHFCVIKPVSIEQKPPDTAAPSTVRVLGEAAWEDHGTLKRKLYSGKQVKVDGFVSVQTEAFVKGRGGIILAAQELVNVKAATDYYWRVLQCVRTNGIGGTIRLVRTRPGDEEYTTFLQEIEPNVVIGSVEPEESGVDIVQAFVRTEARTLLLKSSPQLPNFELWGTSDQPMLDESHETEKGGAQRGRNISFRQPGPHLLSSGGPYQT